MRYVAVLVVGWWLGLTNGLEEQGGFFSVASLASGVSKLLWLGWLKLGSHLSHFNTLRLSKTSTRTCFQICQQEEASLCKTRELFVKVAESGSFLGQIDSIDV